MNKIPDIINLHKEKNKKEIIKNQMYDIVLNKCISNINNVNKFTDKTFILFEVPEIIPGFHNYNLLSCIKYLKEKFNEKNYIVTYIQPNPTNPRHILHIDWGSSKINVELLKKTNELLKKYPDISQVEYIYE